ncbi:MAG: hypothetical protein ACLFN8_04265 [Candidatus Woesearchaeota archaeon]
MSFFDIFRRKKTAFSSEKKKIRNKLNKILKSYNLVFRLVRQSNNYLADAKKLFEVISSLNQDVENSKRNELIKNLNSKLNNIQNNIRRKLRVIYSDINLGKNEDESLRNILSVPGLTDLSSVEQEVLDELIYKKKYEIESLVSKLKELVNHMRVESRIVTQLQENSSKDKLDFNFINNILHETQNCLENQKRVIEFCSQLIREMELESKNIIVENKNIMPKTSCFNFWLEVKSYLDKNEEIKNRIYNIFSNDGEEYKLGAGNAHAAYALGAININNKVIHLALRVATINHPLPAYNGRVATYEDDDLISEISRIDESNEEIMNNFYETKSINKIYPLEFAGIVKLHTKTKKNEPIIKRAILTQDLSEGGALNVSVGAGDETAIITNKSGDFIKEAFIDPARRAKDLSRADKYQTVKSVLNIYTS